MATDERKGASNGNDDRHGSKNKRLFGDVSAIQVIATALASVTSVLLASSIGIAGSIIGVAVASVVSTLAASLYKKFLSDSAEKIKELPVIVKSSKPSDDAVHPEQSNEQDDRPSAINDSTDDEEGHLLEGDGKEQIEKQKKIIRGLVIVCVVSALTAVFVSAAIIDIATTGEGLGHKPTPISFTSKSTSSDAASSSDAAGTQNASENASSENKVPANNVSNPSHDANTTNDSAIDTNRTTNTANDENPSNTSNNASNSTGSQDKTGSASATSPSNTTAQP